MKLHFRPYANPILILNDAPDAHGGLSRIGRDLACLISQMPEFRVGYLGRGAVGNRHLPFMQYSYPESQQWGEEYIQRVWHDFAGEEHGIVFSLWDASRMLWFTQPSGLPPGLQEFLGDGRPFAKWGYFPVDATGPVSMAYGTEMAWAVCNYDRTLAASEWGVGVLRRSGADADWIPHGIWMNVFRPVESPLRQADGPWEGRAVLGCNMANQARKDWPVAFECAAALRRIYGNQFLFWAHTNAVHHCWNLQALAYDYGMTAQTEITTNLSDAVLAARYSACHCTILPSAGEGFGFPIAESQACGTPCVVTDYAAGQEIVDSDCRVAPVAYRVDTQYNVTRAVLSGQAFAAMAHRQIERKRVNWDGVSEQSRARVEHLDWEKIKFVWERWLREGLYSA